MAVHGLIHLLWFAKSFGVLQFGQLTPVIPKPRGLLWLMAFLMISLTTTMLIWSWEWWWVIGILSLALSQSLIFADWHDAKFITLLNLVVAIGIVGAFGRWQLNPVGKIDVNNTQASKSGITYILSASKAPYIYRLRFGEHIKSDIENKQMVNDQNSMSKQ